MLLLQVVFDLIFFFVLLYLLVDTLSWALRRVKARFGYKNRVFLFSDGAVAQNWCQGFFKSLPLLAEQYRGDQELLTFRAQKSVAGHSKGRRFFYPCCQLIINPGEIDSAHGLPKCRVRKFVQLSSKSKQADTRDISERVQTTGFANAEEMTEWLRLQPDFASERTDPIPDSKGFVLVQRHIKMANPDGKSNYLTNILILLAYIRYFSRNSSYE